MSGSKAAQTEEQLDPSGAAIASFVTINSYLNYFQTNVSSRHLAVVFDLRAENIGIYFSKLYSFRVLMMSVGSILEYVTYVASGENAEVRKYYSLATLFLMSILRFITTAILHASKRLPLHYYVASIGDGMLLGSFQNSYMPLVPKYSSITNLSVFICASSVFFVQKAADLFLYQNTLLNLKLQSWLFTLTTSASVGLWVYFILTRLNEPSNKGQGEGDVESGTSTQKNAFDHFVSASSQFMMFGAGSMFKDFLYPGVLPYALLERDKCHLVNLLTTLILIVPPLTVFFLDKFVPVFKQWGPQHSACWFFVVPLLTVLIVSLMAIHTRRPCARAVVNSQPAILAMTLALLVSFTFMSSFGFVGVAYYVQYVSKDKRGSTFLISFHSFLSMFYPFIFSKLSVGYNDTRVSLGYHLPRFRPNHRMSHSNAFWYFFRQTFKRALKDSVNDFKFNIKDYI